MGIYPQTLRQCRCFGPGLTRTGGDALGAVGRCSRLVSGSRPGRARSVPAVCPCASPAHRSRSSGTDARDSEDGPGRSIPSRRRAPHHGRVVRRAVAPVWPHGSWRSVLRRPAEGSGNARYPGHGAEVHQAALGRSRSAPIKDINPLSELEIAPDKARGGRESRFLQFAFNRVMGPQGVKHILCSVTDATAAVMLARETRGVQESPQDANAHVEMMLDLIQVDPLRLGAFLMTADTGLEIVNTMLRKPARSDGEFRDKLHGLSQQFQSLRGEASALNLKSIAARLQHLEELVRECGKAPRLSGADFFPMVLKLDELLAHLTVVRDVATRLAVVKKETTGSTAIADAAVFARKPQSEAASKTPRSKRPTSVSASPRAESATRRAEAASPRSAEEFATLPGIAEILAKEHEKRLALTVVGLDRVPGPYLATIKSCLIHMLRNAAMHGIESPMVRRAENKDETGTLKITFASTADGYQLVFEDDGVGISAESLKQAALRQQLFGLEEAAAMDSRAAVAMIFRPGFSTWKKPTNDIGRGLGMDEVARAVHGLGGRIGVSTRPGKYTRFTITLPAVAAARSEVA